MYYNVGDELNIKFIRRKVKVYECMCTEKCCRGVTSIGLIEVIRVSTVVGLYRHVKICGDVDTCKWYRGCIREGLSYYVKSFRHCGGGHLWVTVMLYDLYNYIYI